MTWFRRRGFSWLGRAQLWVTETNSQIQKAIEEKKRFKWCVLIYNIRDPATIIWMWRHLFLVTSIDQKHIESYWSKFQHVFGNKKQGTYNRNNQSPIPKYFNGHFEPTNHPDSVETEAAVRLLMSLCSSPDVFCSRMIRDGIVKELFHLQLSSFRFSGYLAFLYGRIPRTLVCIGFAVLGSPNGKVTSHHLEI